jgi:hypothetical protein
VATIFDSENCSDIGNYFARREVDISIESERAIDKGCGVIRELFS